MLCTIILQVRVLLTPLSKIAIYDSHEFIARTPCTRFQRVFYPRLTLLTEYTVALSLSFLLDLCVFRCSTSNDDKMRSNFVERDHSHNVSNACLHPRTHIHTEKRNEYKPIRILCSLNERNGTKAFRRVIRRIIVYGTVTSVVVLIPQDKGK